MQIIPPTRNSRQKLILYRVTLRTAAIIVALLAALLVVNNASAFRPELPKPSAMLKGYQLDGKPLSIAGVKDNASGLTYSPKSNTLFMVINNPEEIYELNLSGEVLRRITLHGFQDTEGIAHIEGNRFAILEERRSEINFISLPDNARQIHKSSAERFALNIFGNSKSNSRLEGITFDSKNGDIYLVKEKSPRALYKVSGLFNSDRGVEVTMPWDLEKTSRGLSDLSGLFFASDPNRLLVLSHESSKLTEFELSGLPVSEVKLNRSRRAQFNNIPQAEGVTISADGTLFIISEPNLLYRYVKPKLQAENSHLMAGNNS